jgi:hypothetical protein
VAPQAAPTYPPSYPPQQPPGNYGTYAPPPGYPVSPGFPEQPKAEGAREHDGFFLRLRAGLGAGGLSYDERVDGQRTSDVKTRGLAGAFEVAIGGAVVENLILHGNLSVAVMDSRKRVDGVEQGDDDQLTSTAVLFGGGATYYFMPHNLYLTLVLGTAAMVEDRYDGGIAGYESSIESGAGFGTTLSIGKEWWVGRSGQWGLGVDITGGFYAAPVEIAGTESTMLGNAVSVSFVSTFN